jgi:hypothetical protein
MCLIDFAGWTGRSAAVGRYFGNGQSFVFTFAGRRDAFNAWRAEQLERDAAAEHAAIVSTMREHHDSPHFDTEIQLQTPPPSIYALPPGTSTSSLPPGASSSSIVDGTGASGGEGSEQHNSLINVYRWSRRNKYFQLAGSDGIGMGGGGSFAWYLDGDLDKGAYDFECLYGLIDRRNPLLYAGSSGLCETFLSPCLSAERERFTALRVEVWCFRRRTAVW